MLARSDSLIAEWTKERCLVQAAKEVRFSPQQAEFHLARVSEVSDVV